MPSASTIPQSNILFNFLILVWGECPRHQNFVWCGVKIFALLRLRIERFRFSLIKRNTKQINFLFLLKDKVNCEARESALGRKIAREKIKKCRENFSVLLAVAKRRRAETLGGIINGQPAKRASELKANRDDLRKKFGFRPKGTANLQFQYFWKDLFLPAPAGRSPRLRAGRKGLILQRFATLCVAKKNVLVLDLEVRLSEAQSKTKFCNQSFFVSPLAKLGSNNF